jgi:hypothetical protein
VISGIKSALSFASSLMSKIPFIGGLFSSASAPVPSATRAATASRYLVPVGGGGTPSLAARGLLLGGRRATAVKVKAAPNITVTGALDPVAVAKQIRTLLVTQQRRSGGMAI